MRAATLEASEADRGLRPARQQQMAVGRQGFDERCQPGMGCRLAVGCQQMSVIEYEADFSWRALPHRLRDVLHINAKVLLARR